MEVSQNARVFLQRWEEGDWDVKMANDTNQHKKLEVENQTIKQNCLRTILIFTLLTVFFCIISDLSYKLALDQLNSAHYGFCYIFFMKNILILTT